MPIPASTPVELTDAADLLLLRSHGKNASDEAAACGRIAAYLDERRITRAPLGRLMSECHVPNQVMAALLRTGVLVLLVPEIGVGCCERCGQPSPKRVLCDHCRADIGAGTPPEKPRETVRLVRREFGSRAPAPRRGPSRGMLSRSNLD